MTECRTWDYSIDGVCTNPADIGKSIVIIKVKNAHLYDYKDLANITREELFVWIFVDQVLDRFASIDFLTAIALIMSGQNFIETRGKLGGSTKGTSPASVVSRKLINKNLSFRLPTITGSTLKTLKLTFTKNLGAFVGRAVPIVGWLILVYDIEEIVRKTLLAYNKIAIGDDKLW